MPQNAENLDALTLVEAQRLALERIRYERLIGVEFLPRVRITPPVSVAVQAPQIAQPLRTVAPIQSARDLAAAQLARPNTVAKSPSPPSSRNPAELVERWRVLEETALSCVRCPLKDSRTQVVFGAGDRHARLMFIGQGPGPDEDLSGQPFVGKAGQLLTKIIEAMGFKRDAVYLCDVVKCRTPQNRAPLPDEIAFCHPYLLEQIDLVSPKVIVTLGGPATKALLNIDAGIDSVRGRWREFKCIPVMPTLHPAAVLRTYTPEIRGQVWADMQQVMVTLK